VIAIPEFPNSRISSILQQELRNFGNEIMGSWPCYCTHLTSNKKSYLLTFFTA